MNREAVMKKLGRASRPEPMGLHRGDGWMDGWMDVAGSMCSTGR